jgi:undecaprenyl-diphosphatase
MLFKTYSFPSSHAFSSAAIYGLAACFSSTYVPRQWALTVSISLILLILAIGFSRIYLGAHYVLDVLGGWVLAGGVLFLLIVFLN